MAFSVVERQKLKNAVEQVLHVPGNYRGGILEMAVVVDYHLPLSDIREITTETVSLLKSHSEIFRNVRFHLIHWKSDNTIVKESSSMAKVLTGVAWENYEQSTDEKYLDELTRQLKLYYARSKLILLITDKEPLIREEEQVQKNMQPFLEKKLIYLIKEKENIRIVRANRKE